LSFKKAAEEVQNIVVLSKSMEMPQDNPLWISAWDAAAVLEFKAGQKLARESVLSAVEQDTISALENVVEVC
jgi:hypothetical protein